MAQILESRGLGVFPAELVLLLPGAILLAGNARIRIALRRRARNELWAGVAPTHRGLRVVRQSYGFRYFSHRLECR